MTNLDMLGLLDLIPDRVTDEYIEALAYALDPELQEITATINEAIIMTGIDELPEDLVDLLAWQFHVDFYEPIGLDLDRKRTLVKNSLIWHRYKGTKYALESMISTLFLTNFKIEEWFKYDGKPGLFRLVAWDALREMEQYDDLIRAINELKNERSWLEGITFHKEALGTTYIGIAGKHTRRFQVGGTLPNISEVAPARVHIGNVGRQTSRYTIFGESVVTKVDSIKVNIGFANKHTSKIFIGSSEEENSNVYI